MDITTSVILVYFFLMFLLAISIKGSKDSKDFSKTKNGLGILALATALFMTHYGGGFVLGGAELGYRYGWGGLIYSFSAGLGVILLGILLSKKIYKANKEKDLETIPQFLNNKFNDKKLSYLAASLSIIALVGIASAQLFAAYKIFLLLNLSPIWYTFLIAALIGFFSVKGIRSLAISGKYNLLIASIGALAACFIAFNLKPQIIQPSIQATNVIPLIAILIPTVLYTLIGQDFHQKIYASKSYRTTLYATFIAGTLLIIMGLFPVFIGIKSSELFLIDAAEAMPRFILYVLPSIFKGLFIAAILAAVIGSTQSVINSASTQFSKDFIQQKWKFDTKGLLLIESLLSIILILIALFLTLISSSIISNIILAYTLYTAGMFLPIILAFSLKDCNLIKKHVFVAALIGISLSILIELRVFPLNIPSVVVGIGCSGLYLLTLYLIKKYFKKIWKT